MNKKIMLMIALGSAAISSNAQVNAKSSPGGGNTIYYYEKFQKAFGGSGDDGGSFADVYHSDLKVLPDGYIFGGMSSSPAGPIKTDAGNGGSDYWLIKTDRDGNKLWDKTYGGAQDDKLQQILPTSDGGFLLSGESKSGISGDKTSPNNGSSDLWIIKTDAAGTMLWQKTYGGSGGETTCKNMFEVNGKYYIGLSSASGISGNKTVASKGQVDYGIIALDAATGNIVMEKGYGGATDDDLHSIYVKDDGSFVLFGASRSAISGNKTISALGGWDYWVISCNAAGSILWQKVLGGTNDDFLIDAKYMKKLGADPCFVIAGWSRSQVNATGEKTEATHGGVDIWMVAISTSGVKLWDHTYGGTLDDYPMTIDMHSKEGPLLASPRYDDQILISGFSNSDAYVSANGYKTDNNMGPSDGWLVMTNTNGIQHKDVTLGGNADDAIQVTKAVDVDILWGDIDYVSLSFTATGLNGTKNEASYGKYDMWLYILGKRSTRNPPFFKTSVTEPVPNTTGNVANEGAVKNIYPTIFRNNEVIHIELNDPRELDLSVYTAEVYSITGRKVAAAKLSGVANHAMMQLDLPAAGIYVIQVLDQHGELVHRQKIRMVE